MRIETVHGREVLDSRGQPTVEVEIRLAGGALGRAIAPSGASTGRAEACELRDGDASRYDGRGVRRAVGHVNNVLGPALVGFDSDDQAELDRRLCELDGTPQKSRLGANALLGVSLAAAHAAAAAKGVPLFRHLHDLAQRAAQSAGAAPVAEPRLPMPMTNLISGGLHAGGNLDFQDFLAIPHAAPDYPTALEWIVRVYRRLGSLLQSAGYEGRLVGDEGGFGPRLASNEAAAEFCVRAIEAAGFMPGAQVSLAIDVASSHFWNGKTYRLAATGGADRASSEMIDELARLCDRFPVRTLEDGLAEEDWAGWQALTARLGTKVRLVGDDLFATRSDRVERGLRERTANAVLIKLNQVGTLSETLSTMRLAIGGGWANVVSARSGETEDDTIADLAVATAADYIKIGSIVRSERLAKYNRLLRIAESVAAWAGGT